MESNLIKVEDTSSTQMQAEIEATERLLQKAAPVSLADTLSYTNTDSKQPTSYQKWLRQNKDDMRDSRGNKMKSFGFVNNVDVKGTPSANSLNMSRQERDNLVHRLIQQHQTASVNSSSGHLHPPPSFMGPSKVLPQDTNQKHVRFVDQVDEGAKLAESMKFPPRSTTTRAAVSYTSSSTSPYPVTAESIGQQSEVFNLEPSWQSERSGSTYMKTVPENYQPQLSQQNGFNADHVTVTPPVDTFTNVNKWDDRLMRTSVSTQNIPTYSNDVQQQQESSFHAEGIHSGYSSPHYDTSTQAKLPTRNRPKTRTPFSRVRKSSSRRRTVDQLAQVSK